MNTLTQDQIDAVVDWMNNWEQLKDTAIPLRFKEDWTKQLNLANVSTRYSYYEISERLKTQIDHMIQCVQDSEGTIDPSEDINDIEITLKVLKHVYNVC